MFKKLTKLFKPGATAGATADTDTDTDTDTAAQPLYFLIDPLPAAGKLAIWHHHFPRYDEIIGYSVLGHFFMRSTADGDYMVLHPMKKGAKSYGAHADAAAFERAVLLDEGFADYVLRRDHAAAVGRRLGPLGPGQVYYPVPYPFVGGSDAPETYDKGDVWVFMAIVAQMHGL